MPHFYRTSMGLLFPTHFSFGDGGHDRWIPHVHDWGILPGDGYHDKKTPVNDE